MAEKEKVVVPEIIDNVEALEAKMKAMREAQKIFATFTQEQVDKIFYEAAMAANKQRIPLAKMAVEETQRGVMEDKVIKNHYAAEYIYNAYKNTKTCGVIEEDPAYGIKKVAEPIGLVAAVIPTTNPTSTAIFKTLICLKTRNAIIISPHPRQGFSRLHIIIREQPAYDIDIVLSSSHHARSLDPHHLLQEVDPHLVLLTVKDKRPVKPEIYSAHFFLRVLSARGMSWRRILPVSLTARTGRARKRYARFRRNMKKSIPNTPTRSCAGSPRCSLWGIYLNTAGS